MHPPADEPLRVTGKVKGDLNGVALAEADLHSYVLTGDGRTYTAVSRVPKVSQPPIESIGRRDTRSRYWQCFKSQIPCSLYASIHFQYSHFLYWHCLSCTSTTFTQL